MLLNMTVSLEDNTEQTTENEEVGAYLESQWWTTEGMGAAEPPEVEHEPRGGRHAAFRRVWSRARVSLQPLRKRLR